MIHIFTLDNSEKQTANSQEQGNRSSIALFLTIFSCHSFTLFSCLEIRQQNPISKRRKYKNATKPFIGA